MSDYRKEIESRFGRIHAEYDFLCDLVKEHEEQQATIKTNEARISELETGIKIIDSRLGDGWFKSLVKALASKTE